MSRPRNNIWQAAVVVSLALMLTGVSEANARGGGHGGGGGGHVSGGSSLRSVSGPGQTVGHGFSGNYSASGAFTNPTPSPKPRTSHVVHNYGGGRGGYYNNNYNSYNNNLPNQQNYQQHGAVNGQVFSGAAHIDPSQYGHYVQSYQWPSGKP